MQGGGLKTAANIKSQAFNFNTQTSDSKDISNRPFII
jgi:hypothetical protein